jgi:hypothetical protein
MPAAVRIAYWYQMTHIDCPSYVLYNDSQLGSFLSERADATRDIYVCVEKALVNGSLVIGF